MDVQMDYGDAVYAAMVLDKVRKAIKVDLERKDLPRADRKLLLKRLDILNEIVRTLIPDLPARLGQRIDTLGYPETLVIAEWGDMIDVYETHGDDDLAETLERVQADGAVTTSYRVLRETDQPVTVYTSPEGGGEEAIRERELELANRQRKLADKNYSLRKYGQQPNYRFRRF